VHTSLLNVLCSINCPEHNAELPHLRRVVRPCVCAAME
jgi:hypothetical protein